MTMKSLAPISLLIALIACAAPPCVAQSPYIGYIYPAGGQQGSVFQIIIGGQRIRGSRDILVSGSGVHAVVLDYQGASGPLNRAQQEELRRRIQEIRAKRTGGQSGVGRKSQKANPAKPPADANATPVALPDLPELKNLDQKTPLQLQQLANKFLNMAMRPKPPIAEQVTLEVTIDPDAAPGDRELRVQTQSGLTNPLVFQVGQIPETVEPSKDDELGILASVQPPVVINGQIMPGEIDRFPLQLQGGQKLVIAAQARKLIPYLADAVPGWFQAVVSISDSDGKELAYANECGFDPDPALVFQVPRDGSYTLAVRDALYRGREDFVYRVDIEDISLAQSLFPLGSRGGIPICAAPASQDIRLKLAQEHFQFTGNSTNETEPNNTTKAAMGVALPRIVSGCISAPGDNDVFRFDGRAGQQVVAEVYARRMGSALDSLLRLTDASGHVVACNDDHEDMESGLLTHQADSYVSAKLPATGQYYLQLSDAQDHGGPEYCYYLRIAPPQPDFALRISPSSLDVNAGRAVSATVYVSRKDGWDGNIDLAITDPSTGFTLSGGQIPKGVDKMRVILIAPEQRSFQRFGRRFSQPVALQLEGRAQIDGKAVTRPVVPAENMMQAFAYYHLVPSEQLIAMITGGGSILPKLELASGDRLQIPSGGSAKVTYSMPGSASNSSMRLDLVDPPAGVTLQDATPGPGGITLLLKADDKHIGCADNLVVEAFTEQELRRQGKATGQKQRVSLGVLPAVPFEIVKP